MFLKQYIIKYYNKNLIHAPSILIIILERKFKCKYFHKKKRSVVLCEMLNAISNDDFY